MIKKVNYKKILSNTRSGFTLIELMVVLAIVGVVSGVIVFNYPSFRNNATLRSLSQEVALSIRKAQTYATSVQSIPTGASTVSFPAYGISFSKTILSSPDVATPTSKQFILFADVDGDNAYDKGTTCGAPATNSECLESFTISTPDRVKDVCADSTCISSGTVDIVFKRPSPDAKICIGSNCTYASATITIESQAAKTRAIKVWNTGQISVE